uniref:Si:dkeyp-97b10.3 n=1 Tax=Scophthalmus maximus TaxID=52904 RepID=A0A8D3ALZ4_SCOMX
WQPRYIIKPQDVRLCWRFWIGPERAPPSLTPRRLALSVKRLVGCLPEALHWISASDILYGNIGLKFFSPIESVAGPEAVFLNGKDERQFRLCCEKCKAIQQSHGNELVSPWRTSKGQLQVQLEGEGTYECSVTGLVFEASERVLVRYSVLSWSKYGAFLRDSWKFAGPIFNVDTVNKDASVLKSIQFPHSVCLYDPDNEMTFSVLHLKDNRPVIEPTVDHSGSHVKWNVTSLSPLGPIIKTSQPVEHHGVVLVYKQLGSDDNNCSFHIYLATNSSSDIKDICKQVRGYKNRYFRIEKPPTCKLDEGTYRLLSEPEGDIKPQVIVWIKQRGSQGKVHLADGGAAAPQKTKRSVKGLGGRMGQME